VVRDRRFLRGWAWEKRVSPREGPEKADIVSLDIGSAQQEKIVSAPRVMRP
jgi:hypothetical protein